jgi:ribosomal protein S12 methylthiotransferase
MDAYFISLGCPKNTVDMEATISLLNRCGHGITDNPYSADLLLVNACSFLEGAWVETREEIERLARVKQEGKSKKLIVMGCLPKNREEDLSKKLPEVDYFLPPGRQAQLPAVIRCWETNHPFLDPRMGELPDVFAGFEKRQLLTPQHSAYVKIAEGCSHDCSFCSIPRIKGPLASREPDSIEREVRYMLEEGVREITLIAQDTAAYQKDDLRLPDLVGRLSRTGVSWIRILYIHPASLRIDELKRLLAIPHVCHYMDIPVQHACDRILSGMKRGHTVKYLRRLIDEIKSACPDVVLRSEVIVGYPGETDGDFEVLKEFISWAGFGTLGIFAFSAEPGTAACELEHQVPSALKKERLAELGSLQDNISFALNSRYIGETFEILVDREIHPDEDAAGGCTFAGRYYGQALDIDGEVFLRGEGLGIGQLVSARIVDADVFDLVGEVDLDEST